MKMEYVAIVEMNGCKYNAIVMSGLYGSSRTVDTVEKAQKALDSYVSYLTGGQVKHYVVGNISVCNEAVKHKIDKAYIKARQVTEWEIL